MTLCTSVLGWLSYGNRHKSFANVNLSTPLSVVNFMVWTIQSPYSFLLQISDPGQFVDLIYCRRLRSAGLRQQVI